MGVSRGGFYMPGANTTGYNNNMPQVQQMDPAYKAQLAEQNRIKKLVAAYKTNPSQYDQDESMQLQQLAVGAGIPMAIQSEPGAKWIKGGLAALDTALFGLVPNSVYEPVNAAEKKAVAYGSMAGMLIPWGAPFRAAGGVVRGVKAAAGIKKASTIAKTAKKMASPTVASEFVKGLKNPFGAGKYLPFMGQGGKAASKVKSLPNYLAYNAKKHSGKGSGFSKLVNANIKHVGRADYEKAIALGKTPAEKAKLGAAWMKTNTPELYNKIGFKRLQGWVKLSLGKGGKSKVKKSLSSIKRNKKGQVINPSTGKPLTSTELLNISGKKKVNPFLEDIAKDYTKKQSRPNQKLLAAPKSLSPQQLIQVTKRANKKTTKLSPKQQAIKIAKQRQTKSKKVVTQTGSQRTKSIIKNKKSKISPKTVTALKGKKNLTNKQSDFMVRLLPQTHQLLIQGIKNPKLKSDTIKKMAKRLNLI
jgi:hypothetical protein